MISKIKIKGKQGNIVGILQLPRLGDCEKCPMVLILHGIYDDKETPLIHSVASELYARGIGSLRIDFNGHGESDGRFIDMTISKEIDDARRAVDFLWSLSTTESVSVIGHSQGGVVAGMLAGRLGEDKIDSLVLLAAAACLKDDCQNGCLFGSTFDPNNIPETLDNFWGTLGHDYLLENQKLNIYGDTARYEGQICIIHGTADELVPIKYADQYADLLPDANYHLLEDVNHYFEPRQKEAVDIACDFIEEI